MRRSSTASSVIARRLRDCGIEDVAQAVAEQVEAEHGEEDREPGKTESHGAVVIWSRASDSMLPQLG
jgi:hypothetical protein